MKFKFAALVAIQVGGECMLEEDGTIAVRLEDQLLITPNFVVSQLDGLKDLSEPEQKTIFALLTSEILNRSAQAATSKPHVALPPGEQN